MPSLRISEVKHPIAIFSMECLFYFVTEQRYDVSCGQCEIKWTHELSGIAQNYCTILNCPLTC